MLLASGAGVFGTLPGWLTLGALCAAAWTFRRGGGGAALDSLDTANRVLTNRVKELEASDATKDKQLAELKGRTDVALALAPILKWTTQHEERAQERQIALLGVLELIAQRLGPEQNGHAEAT